MAVKLYSRLRCERVLLQQLSRPIFESATSTVEPAYFRVLLQQLSRPIFESAISTVELAYFRECYFNIELAYFRECYFQQLSRPILESCTQQLSRPIFECYSTLSRPIFESATSTVEPAYFRAAGWPKHGSTTLKINNHYWYVSKGNRDQRGTLRCKFECLHMYGLPEKCADWQVLMGRNIAVVVGSPRLDPETSKVNLASKKVGVLNGPYNALSSSRSASNGTIAFNFIKRRSDHIWSAVVTSGLSHTSTTQQHLKEDNCREIHENTFNFPSTITLCRGRPRHVLLYRDDLVGVQPSCKAAAVFLRCSAYLQGFILLPECSHTPTLPAFRPLEPKH
ncbi:hypothetical protein EVAR_14992_1 [Eumeta japonica]|uniref:Uncharacterized protein n=1 Tax=Eumeta variegata TaxID=151549 RepID=A0A4C1X5F8_EUMVA|nr:hypothetical protein EVAR_14992_1 [Eumeta japonica]